MTSEETDMSSPEVSDLQGKMNELEWTLNMNNSAIFRSQLIAQLVKMNQNLEMIEKAIGFGAMTMSSSENNS